MWWPDLAAWNLSQKLCQPIVLSFVPSRENRIGLNWIRSSIDFQFSYRHGIIFPSFIFFWQNFLYLQCHHAKLAFLNKKKCRRNVCWLQLALFMCSCFNPLLYRVSDLKMFFQIIFSAVLLKMFFSLWCLKCTCQWIFDIVPFNFGK